MSRKQPKKRLAKDTTSAGPRKTERALTAKQSSFCEHIVAGASQAAAYRAAYDAGRMTPEAVHQEASRLMANPRVATRVSLLRAESAERTLHSLDRLVAEAEQVRVAAMGRSSLKVAVEAIGLKARLLGYADRPPVHVTPPIEETDYSRISTADLLMIQASINDAAKRARSPTGASSRS